MTKNEGNLDRMLRIAAGAVLVLWAAAFDGPVWAWIGVLPLLTGVIGICPAYGLLGINTCPLKK